ncbi:7234_t:CDS:2 [Gigaspora margarita]|uniref:7234_t:CDS:1 n=1 Tax=Gigaspora margarita TaxID=4874 RepID=A0ABN7W1F4_GIGMA|nr:7234_t:CDS:2 [Gigaspora margarita]
MADATRLTSAIPIVMTYSSCLCVYIRHSDCYTDATPLFLPLYENLHHKYITFTMKDKPKRTNATIACTNFQKKKRIRRSGATVCENCVKQNLQCTFVKSNKKSGPKGNDNKNIINQDDKYRANYNSHNDILVNNHDLFYSSFYPNLQATDHFVNYHGSQYSSESQPNFISQESTHYSIIDCRSLFFFGVSYT